MRITRCRMGIAALLASGLTIFPVGVGRADDSAAASAGISTGPNPDRGIPVGGWVLYPSFFAGPVYNDNIYNKAANRVSGMGLRLRPAFEADRDTGIHRTTLYVNADLQVYPGHGQTVQYYPTRAVLAGPSNATARMGVAHTYSPLPDFKITVIGDYTRASGGLFGAGGFGAGAPLAAVANAATLTGNGSYSNQLTGSISAEKQIERAFLRGTVAAQYVAYDSQPYDSWFMRLVNPLDVVSGNIQNALDITASLRGGYWITPQVYAFVEPTGDFRRYASSASDTNGYKITAGLGSDLISLFRGEIYGGYQAQSSAYGRFGTVASPAFGGRIFYYPTRDLTFTATLDQSFTAPLAQAVAVGGVAAFYAPTAPTRTLQARLQADYAITEYWTTFARGGWGESKTSGAQRWSAVGPIWTQGAVTTVWSAGLGASYTFWRSFALTFEYQFSKTLNPPNTGWATWWMPTSVTQNLVTSGLTYRY